MLFFCVTHPVALDASKWVTASFSRSCFTCTLKGYWNSPRNRQIPKQDFMWRNVLGEMPVWENTKFLGSETGSRWKNPQISSDSISGLTPGRNEGRSAGNILCCRTVLRKFMLQGCDQSQVWGTRLKLKGFGSVLHPYRGACSIISKLLVLEAKLPIQPSFPPGKTASPKKAPAWVTPVIGWRQEQGARPECEVCDGLQREALAMTVQFCPSETQMWVAATFCFVPRVFLSGTNCICVCFLICQTHW
jgi:hypothetical protein